MRRPSPAMLVALLALFVALGGPAQAKRLIDGADIRKGTVRSRQIKDRTITTSDIARSAVRALQNTPDATITDAKLAPAAVSGAKLANGAVTAAKVGAGQITGPALADGSVGPSKLLDGSVGAAKIADGSLSTADIARFYGRFRVAPEDIGTIQPDTCWSGVPRQLAPEAAGADISQDIVLVTPRTAFNERALSFSYRMASADATDPASLSRFVLALCNVTAAPVPPPAQGIAFSYVVFDIP